jgi:undecaprenyl diphosphate synthase
MRFIGRRTGVAPRAARADALGGGRDRANERITLFVAFNYGGRAEIVDAARAFTGDTRTSSARTSTRPTCTIPT